MRKYEIDIDGQPFLRQTGVHSLRVTFNARQSYSDNLAFLELSIFNLSEETKVKEGKEIVFSAGYDEEFDVIFRGRITTVLKEREGANVATKLLCVSFDNSVRKSIAKTLGRNCTVVQCLNECAKALEVPLNVNKGDFKDDKEMISGYVMNGDVMKVLGSLGRMFNFSFLLTKDSLIIDKNGAKLKGVAREVSAFTGMIGVPELTGDMQGIFVNVTSKLSPKIRIKSNIEIKSKFASFNTGNFYIEKPKFGSDASGVYKVIEVQHMGDSHGSRWVTNLKGMRNVA